MEQLRKGLVIASALSALATLHEFGCGGGENAPQPGPGGGSGGAMGATGTASGGASGSSQVGMGAGGSAVVGGTGGEATASGGASPGGSAGSTGAAGTNQNPSGMGLSTEANLKIAFVGDTDDGSDWKAVAALIKAEGAQAVAVAGDMTYAANPTAWWTVTEAAIGTSYPIFLARGNHDDSSWSGFLPKAATHLGGAERKAGPHDAAYTTVFKGLSIGAIQKGDKGTVVTNLFAGDNHIWKVCLWHQNMEKMQVGGKGDEMGWDTYEACRQAGAIIVSGHEHTYHRTKTLTNMQAQTVDPTCSTGEALCVGKGRTFVTVSGLGGTGIREQVRCNPAGTTKPFPSLNTSDTSCPIWASIYTSNQGAKFGSQFIVFNVGGNEKKAHGFFKNVSNEIIDEFDITAD